MTGRLCEEDKNSSGVRADQQAQQCVDMQIRVNMPDHTRGDPRGCMCNYSLGVLGYSRFVFSTTHQKTRQRVSSKKSGALLASLFCKPVRGVRRSSYGGSFYPRRSLLRNQCRVSPHPSPHPSPARVKTYGGFLSDWRGVAFVWCGR